MTESPGNYLRHLNHQVMMISSREDQLNSMKLTILLAVKLMQKLRTCLLGIFGLKIEKKNTIIAPDSTPLYKRPFTNKYVHVCK